MNNDTVRCELCPLCGSVDCTKLFVAVDVQFSKTLEEFPIVKCKNCALQYLKERPNLSAIANFYPKSYGTYQAELSSNQSVGNKVRTIIGKYAKSKLKKRQSTILDKILRKVIPNYWNLALSLDPNSNVLDVGCGAGWKLDKIKEFGCNTYGVDISQDATQVAHQKGHNVIFGEIDDIPWPEKFFDGILISHVIEHLPDPVGTIKKVFLLLKKDGLLLVETPNQKGILATIFKQDYWQVDAPRHFQLFNKNNLKFLLENNGFHIKQIKFESYLYGGVNSIKAMLMRKKYIAPDADSISLPLRIFGYSLAIISFITNTFGLGESIIILASKVDTPNP